MRTPKNNGSISDKLYALYPIVIPTLFSFQFIVSELRENGYHGKFIIEVCEMVAHYQILHATTHTEEFLSFLNHFVAFYLAWILYWSILAVPQAQHSLHVYIYPCCAKSC